MTADGDDRHSPSTGERRSPVKQPHAPRERKSTCGHCPTFLPVLGAWRHPGVAENLEVSGAPPDRGLKGPQMAVAPRAPRRRAKASTGVRAQPKGLPPAQTLLSGKGSYGNRQTACYREVPRPPSGRLRRRRSRQQPKGGAQRMRSAAAGTTGEALPQRKTGRPAPWQFG